MTDNELKISALTGLALNFGKEMPKELLKLWMRGLEAYSGEEVAAAAMQVIDSYVYKTLPPFAVLKQYLPRRGPALPAPEEAARVKAEAEWQRLMDDVRHYGYYNEPTMMHPTTSYVLETMGGWPAACGWPESELHWRRKEFLEAWERTDGLDVDMLRGGARALERRQAQIALGTDDDATLRKITRDSIRRLQIEAETETEGRA